MYMQQHSIHVVYDIPIIRILSRFVSKSNFCLESGSSRANKMAVASEYRDRYFQVRKLCCCGLLPAMHAAAGIAVG